MARQINHRGKGKKVEKRRRDSVRVAIWQWQEDQWAAEVEWQREEARMAAELLLGKANKTFLAEEMARWNSSSSEDHLTDASMTAQIADLYWPYVECEANDHPDDELFPDWQKELRREASVFRVGRLTRGLRERREKKRKEEKFCGFNQNKREF